MIQTRTILLAILAAAAVAGCGQQEPISKMLNGWSVDASNEREIRQAVITEQTLHPYHFQAGSARLSEIGQDNVRILAEFYRDNPGRLSIRQGDADAALYKARVATVMDTLVCLGVQTARMRVEDLPPGGPGLDSNEVVRILKKPDANYAENYGQPIINNIVPGGNP